MTSTAAISVCVLAYDDAVALQLTLDAAAGLGTLVVGVPEGSVAPLPHTAVKRTSSARGRNRVG